MKIVAALALLFLALILLPVWLPLVLTLLAFLFLTPVGWSIVAFVLIVIHRSQGGN